MKIKFIEMSAGIKAGTELEAPIHLAKDLISKGIAEEVKLVEKEIEVKLETKELKKASSIKTKGKK